MITPFFSAKGVGSGCQVAVTENNATTRVQMPLPQAGSHSRCIEHHAVECAGFP